MDKKKQKRIKNPIDFILIDIILFYFLNYKKNYNYDREIEQIVCKKRRDKL